MRASCINSIITGLKSNPNAEQQVDSRFLPYQTDPAGYAKAFLGFTPWEGRNGQPGQAELFRDIGQSVADQLAGRPAIRYFHIEAGHGVGKTYGVAALVNWFFDCFPSITKTTAPTSNQVVEQLWKNIKRLRGSDLGGRVLPSDARMERGPAWFANGSTTSDAGKKGSERFQGQHHEYMLFVVDEAEGVPEFVFDAIDAMMTGGVVLIAIYLANPKTLTSRFHKLKYQTGVKSYRLSVLDFPNVVDGIATVPGGTARSWVQSCIEKWCEPVSSHEIDDHTFTVGFEVERAGVVYQPGQIWKPNFEFCFRVLGVAPANLTGNTFFSIGRYEAAKTREISYSEADEHKIRIGVDCARFGDDSGTIYVRERGTIKRYAQVSQGDTDAYVTPIRNLLIEASMRGVTDVEVRIDGTGGFGAGLVDSLRKDESLRKLFSPPRPKEGDEPRTKEEIAKYKYKIVEVQFGSSAHDRDKYADAVTEMYAESAETINGLRVVSPPNELEGDLTERTYEFVNRSGRELKKLTPKDEFKDKHKGRSPDDGDGFVLAASPDYIFADDHDLAFFTIRL